MGPGEIHENPSFGASSDTECIILGNKEEKIQSKSHKVNTQIYAVPSILRYVHESHQLHCAQRQKMRMQDTDLWRLC